MNIDIIMCSAADGVASDAQVANPSAKLLLALEGEGGRVPSVTRMKTPLDLGCMHSLSSSIMSLQTTLLGTFSERLCGSSKLSGQMPPCIFCSEVYAHQVLLIP